MKLYLNGGGGGRVIGIPEKSRWEYYEEKWRENYQRYQQALAKASALASQIKGRWTKVSESYTPKKGEIVYFRFVSRKITASEITYYAIKNRAADAVRKELEKRGFIVREIKVYTTDEEYVPVSTRLGTIYRNFRIVVEGYAEADPALAVIALVCVTVIASIIGVTLTTKFWAEKEFYVYKQETLRTLQKKLETAEKIAETAEKIAEKNPAKANELIKKAADIVESTNRQIEKIVKEEQSGGVEWGIGAGLGALAVLALIYMASRKR